MPYPPPPGPRIAYDADGSVGLLRSADAGLVYDVHPNALAAMNSERVQALVVPKTVHPFASPSDLIPSNWICVLLPTAFRLRGIYVVCAYLNTFASGAPSLVPARVQTASDSTNGVDGTWTDLVSSDSSIPTSTQIFGVRSDGVTYDGNVAPTGMNSAMTSANDHYRRLKATDGTGIIEVNGPGTRQVRAVRIYRATSTAAFTGGGDTHAYQLHLYGEPDTDAEQDRLALWKPTLTEDVGASWFDWGDIPPGSSADKSFRIKNLSSALTANDIVVDIVQGASTTVPAPHDSMLLSADGGATWSSTLDVAALSPGAVSGVLMVRRTTPLNAELSNWAPRLSVEAGSWS